MDTLSQMLHSKISTDNNFKYHWRCEKTKTEHLCFADDLMIFFYGDSRSASLIKDTLNLFHDFTCLSANNDKSCLFMAGVTEVDGDSIKHIFQFPMGSLPVKYLGVPLITSRLKKDDCKDLTKKIIARIQSWTSKFLSYAGRVQLVNYVIMGIYNYWAGMLCYLKVFSKILNK